MVIDAACPALPPGPAFALVGEARASDIPTPLSTRGSRIVDAGGRSVRLVGVNWFGLETKTFSPHGLWATSYKETMAGMRELGFNTLRLPFSNELFDEGRTPTEIDFDRNPELRGLTGLEIVDRIVEEAGRLGLRIILDRHRGAAGDSAEDSGLWHSDAYPETRWIADWQMLAQRYKGNPAVIGADLHNEPHGPATWGSGDPATDWAAAATRAGNAVLAVNPDWLIFVEGVQTHDGIDYWWGGNLIGAGAHPIRLDRPNKLVYSAHDYPPSLYRQAWLRGTGFEERLPAVFRQMWGYLSESGTAPVFIGELGSKFEEPDDDLWMKAMISYLNGDRRRDGVTIGWSWWAWNPNSGDTGGLLTDDWTTVDRRRLDRLAPLLSADACSTAREKALLR